MYWDINTRKYWPEMLKLLGIQELQLPLIHRQGETIGKITPEGAKLFGLSPNMELNIGALDQACGALGVGNVLPGSFSDSTGSNLSTVTIVDKLVLDPSMQMPCFAGAIPGQYMLHAFSSGGMILRWFRDTFCEVEMEREAKNGEVAFDQICREADKINPGCDGLIMIPHLQGSGPPDTDNNSKGVFFGITLAHKKAHFVRAIMESIVVILRRMMQAMEGLGVQFDNIIALGGGSKSSFWCQLKADATGLPVRVMSTNQSSACLGAAILAGVACGIWESYEQAADTVIKAVVIYQPHQELKGVYDELFDRSMNIWRNIRPLFKI
jgi:xylulokinase